MKIEATPTEKDQVKLVAEVQQEKKLKFIGSTTPKRGHSLFTLELATGKITKTVMEANILFIDGKKVLSKRVDVQEGCQYISALNEANARKKLVKLGILKA